MSLDEIIESNAKDEIGGGDKKLMFKIKLNNAGLFNQEKYTNGTLLQSNYDVGTIGDIKERFVSIKIKR